MSRIMVVDDDFDILRYCESMLAPQGHEVIVCSSGRKALETLISHNVELLVVDVVMPDMTGFDLLKTVNTFKHFHAPILMLTGRKAPEDVRMALKLGATDYMVKPLDRDVFLSKINSILGLQSPGPRIQFASGSANTAAEVTYPALITSVTEMGLNLRTLSYVDRNVRIKIASGLFQEMGITCPPLRTAGCRPIEDDSQYHYEVFVSFIGLDEHSMKKIRRWITRRAISTRKAG